MTTYQWEQPHEPMPPEVRDSLLDIRKDLLVLSWLPDRRTSPAPTGLGGRAAEMESTIGDRNFTEYAEQYLLEHSRTLEDLRTRCNEASAFPAASWLEEIRQGWEDELEPSDKEIDVEWLDSQAELIFVTIDEDLQQAFGEGHRLSL